MKKVNAGIRIAARAVTGLLLTVASVDGAQGQTAFRESAFSDLITEAREESKYIMIDAYTDWCGWCKTMDRETFADSATGAYLNERFVNAKINAEEGFGIDFAMKYRVSQFPQYLFFDGEGQLIARLSGFMKPKDFTAAVQEAVFESAHLPKGPAPLDFEGDFPDFYRNSFRKNKERTYPSAAEVEGWLDSREDLTDEASWGVMHRFIGGGKYALRMAELREPLIEKYGRDEVIGKLAALVFNDVKTAIKERNEEILFNALRAGDSFLGEDAPRYRLRYTMYYYQMTDDLDRYLQTAASGLRAGTADGKTAVQAAATVGAKTTDPDLSARAVGLAAPFIDHEDYEQTLLAATLYLRADDPGKAREFAEKAKKNAAEAGDPTEAADAVLNDLK